MRRDAGRSLEPVIVLGVALGMSLIAGAWSPWGYLAGPAFLALLVVGGLVAFLISEKKRR